MSKEDEEPLSLRTGVKPTYLEVEISHAGGAWDMAAEEIVLRVAQSVYETEGKGGPAELSVLLADDAFVQSLNRKFRGKDQPTNVLSFPQVDGPGEIVFQAARPLGDIAFAYETLVVEAKHQGKSFDDHLAHLVVHGVLHLLGHDHIDDEEAEAMETLERVILDRFGIADPYASQEIDQKDLMEKKQ